MDNIIKLQEGARFFKRRLRILLKGTKQYKGDARQICTQIIDDCWNGKYFMTGQGNFCEFWIRDFSFCLKPLLNLDYREKVVSTLWYALDIFRKHGRITTTISPKGYPFDVFTYSPDSLPLFLFSLRLAGMKEAVEMHKPLLQSEIDRFYAEVVDPATGLVKKDKWFSSIKDNAVRTSSMYNNTMVAMLSQEIDKAGLRNPFRKFNYKKLLVTKFWTGKYFLNDLSGRKTIAGDANVFPYWTGVIENKEMLSSSVETIRKHRLDRPFPLKYTRETSKESIHRLLNLIVPNYEGNSIWMHMGPVYVQTVAKLDKDLANRYISKYVRVIEKNKNFFEVFTPEGKIYKTLLYYADEGMLWASIVFDLMENAE